jgi:hypothetical protein
MRSSNFLEIRDEDLGFLTQGRTVKKIYHGEKEALAA